MYKTIIVICFILSLAIPAFSQDNMAPPPPLDNKVYEAMVGDWTADAMMMGMPYIENMKITWDLNHQFIIIDLLATNKTNTSMSYQGKGVFGIDNKGNAKTWWFDTWGAANVSTGTGFFDGDVLTMNSGNDMFKETRTFTVDGNKITMNATGSAVASGKDIPYDETTVFTKK